MNTVWVFHAEGARFAGGVFATTDQAEKWIAEHSLTGVLTEYRVGTGVLDWAVAHGLFKQTKPMHREPRFVGGFTGAGQDHIHYENGRRA